MTVPTRERRQMRSGWKGRLMGYEIHGTTICAVKKDGKIAIAGDGQVTLENTIMKPMRAQGAQALR